VWQSGTISNRKYQLDALDYDKGKAKLGFVFVNVFV
jgi:hypothetical protein